MPFNTEQFLDVFARYNEAVLPLQIIFVIAALVTIRLATNGDTFSSKTVAGVLSFLWIWMGVIYHWLFFSGINSLAMVFGGFFVLQSAILFYAGVARSDVVSPAVWREEFDRNTVRRLRIIDLSDHWHVDRPFVSPCADIRRAMSNNDLYVRAFAAIRSVSSTLCFTGASGLVAVGFFRCIFPGHVGRRRPLDRWIDRGPVTSYLPDKTKVRDASRAQS